jgi:hypothetical protein
MAGVIELNPLQQIFPYLAVPGILTLRLLSKSYQRHIDTHPDLQARISELYFYKMATHVNIPPKDLYLTLFDSQLGVKIQSILSIHHFTACLDRALPWISHLTVQDGAGDCLNELIKKMVQSGRLKSLFLQNCTLEKETVSFLAEKATHTRSFPTFYLCDVKGADLELPNKQIHRIVTVDPSKSNAYSLEWFIKKVRTEESLKQFNKEVNCVDAPAANVLKAFHSLEQSQQEAFANTLWNMVSYVPRQTLPCRIRILEEAEAYLAANPHHPAVLAALPDD